MNKSNVGYSLADPGSAAVLDEQQVQEYHDRGLLTVDFGFSGALLDDIVNRVHDLYEENFQRGLVATTRVQDAWVELPEVRELAIDPRVLAALEQLVGRKALPFQTLNFPTGTAQLPHSDTIHFSTMPEGYMAGVWVALEDIDSDNGPLIYYPGSHKLPYFKMHDLHLPAGEEHYPGYEQEVQRLIRVHELQPEYGEIRKGQAIIWHANLLHGGAPQHDRRRSRHSQVTHYYFEGCKYYTPMVSSPGEPVFREPTWIPLAGQRYKPRKMNTPPPLLERLARRLGVNY